MKTVKFISAKNVILSLVLVLTTLTSFAGTKANQKTKFNSLGFKEATHQAEYRKKPMFMFIGSASCLQSKREEDVFKMSEVAEELNSKFYCNKFDAESFGGLVKASLSWGVKSYPTVLFFASNGKLIYKEEGYKSKAQMMEVIAKAEQMIAEYEAKKNKKSGDSETEEVVTAQNSSN